jgi:hypothetical protein
MGAMIPLGLRSLRRSTDSARYEAHTPPSSWILALSSCPDY